MFLKTICIQGLGFVGLAMAVAVADATDSQGMPVYNVVGFELDNEDGKEKVDKINSGLLPLACEDRNLREAFTSAISRGNLSAVTDSRKYHNADIVLVDVNLDILKQADGVTVHWAHFENAIRTIGDNIQENALVIIETTVPPGTTEKVVLPILQACFRSRGFDPCKVLLAYSYERVMPGKDYLKSIKNFWRVYSACSDKAQEQCKLFLETIVNVNDYPLTCLASPRASETAKIMENSYRAVNIAFVEEWSQFAQEIGIDLFEVIHAIKKRPTHSNIMFPGFGVGGYCLTKDPLFGKISSKDIFGDIPVNFIFSSLAVETNGKMPYQSLALLKELIGEIQGKKVLLLGVSYRQGVGDTRQSASEIFSRKLKELGADMAYHDPYVNYWDEMKEPVFSQLPDANAFDAVVLAVAHQQYKDIDFTAWLKLGTDTKVLDANHVLTPKQRAMLAKNNITYRAIGVGREL